MEFKDRLKYLRLEKGLSHTQLASLFEKSESAVRAWETGRNKPDADTLIQLGKFFECSTDYLLGEMDFKNNESYYEHLASKDSFFSEVEELSDEIQRKDLIAVLSALVHNYRGMPISNDNFGEIGVLLDLLGYHSRMIETVYKAIKKTYEAIEEKPEISAESKMQVLQYLMVATAFRDEVIRMLNAEYQGFNNWIFEQLGYPETYIYDALKTRKVTLQSNVNSNVSETKED